MSSAALSDTSRADDAIDEVVTDLSGDGPFRGRSDASLLVEAGEDSSAFSELYVRHVGAVYRWLYPRLQWAASDLTAETFARAWLSRGRLSRRPRRVGLAVAA